jgi:LysM repeat protein
MSSRHRAGGAFAIAVKRLFEQRWWICPLVAAAALGWGTRADAVEGDPDAATDPPGVVAFHTVAEGDTLYAIANHYGSSVELIIEANGIDDVLMLVVGTRLRLPILPGAPRSTGPSKRGSAAGTASANLEHLLESSEARVREARFESALELAESVRVALNARNASSNDPMRARLQLVKATSQVALGQTDAALDSMERALLADPNLELDPAVTSPNLMAVFYVARGGKLPTP